jgi:hypothetical protein
MGRRKKAAKKVAKKKKAGVARTFKCLFCNHEDVVSCRLDMKSMTGWDSTAVLIMSSLLSLWQSLVLLFWTHLLEMFHYDCQTQPWIDCLDLPLGVLDSRDMRSPYTLEFNWSRSMCHRNRSLLPSSSSHSIGKIHCMFSLLRSVTFYVTITMATAHHLSPYTSICHNKKRFLWDNCQLILYLQQMHHYSNL